MERGPANAAGYAPAVGWYRKDFVLPSSAAADTWIVRFESVNNRATIWLNGHEIGTHTGAFLPFEVVLPAAVLHRAAVNRLVVRVDDAHKLTDLPPASRAGPHGIVGGWWNYGGILREVYLRRVQSIDFQSVQVLPRLSCASCAAEIDYSVVLHNDAHDAQRVSLRTSYGGLAADLGTHTIAAGAERDLHRPRACRPAGAVVAGLAASLRRDARRAAVGASHPSAVASYTLQSGIRPSR